MSHNITQLCLHRKFRIGQISGFGLFIKCVYIYIKTYRAHKANDLDNSHALNRVHYSEYTNTSRSAG